MKPMDFPKQVLSAAGLIALMFMLAMGSAQAQEKTTRLGVVDVERVTRQSETIQGTIRKAEAAVAGQQKKIDSRLEELKRLRLELRQQQSVLSETETAAKEKALRDLKEEIDDIQYEVNKKLERIRIDLMNPEVDRIMATVRKVAEKEGFDLVIRAEMALYFNDKVDLTPLVIQELDRKPKISAGKKSVEDTPKAE